MKSDWCHFLFFNFRPPEYILLHQVAWHPVLGLAVWIWVGGKGIHHNIYVSNFQETRFTSSLGLSAVIFFVEFLWIMYVLNSGQNFSLYHMRNPFKKFCFQFIQLNVDFDSLQFCHIHVLLIPTLIFVMYHLDNVTYFITPVVYHAAFYFFCSLQENWQNR